MKSTRVLLATTIALVLTATTATAAPGDVQTVTTLDYAAGEHPEGIAAARDGSLYVGMAPTGQLARVDLDGEVTPLGAPAFPAESGYLLGLALDDDEQVYGAVVRFDGGPTGVWRYDTDTAAWALFAATDPTGFPNGLAFTDDGTLLVSDMTLGTIWAVDETGNVSTWLHDTRLEGGGPNDAGVNGLAVARDGSVWFTNSERATVGRITVDRRGAAVGRPKVVAHDDLLTFADGLTLDRDGNAWVAASYGSDRLLRVTSRGRVRVVADRSVGLDYTASVTFGRTKRTKHTLYFTNSGDDFQEPSVMSYR
ncbi:SMP-30/gluconolactonase/LRE family protein [Nocardioides caricicola]|uniref:SMP-30/gluconolactonase/LRE family protein n=1 Tax=Nocardioides caricicola TaxID=634770 RepID=A0ABW0MW47_9ACTN